MQRTTITALMLCLLTVLAAWTPLIGAGEAVLGFPADAPRLVVVGDGQASLVPEGLRLVAPDCEGRCGGIASWTYRGADLAGPWWVEADLQTDVSGGAESGATRVMVQGSVAGKSSWGQHNALYGLDCGERCLQSGVAWVDEGQDAVQVRVDRLGSPGGLTLFGLRVARGRWLPGGLGLRLGAVLGWLGLLAAVLRGWTPRWRGLWAGLCVAVLVQLVPVSAVRDGVADGLRAAWQAERPAGTGVPKTAAVVRPAAVAKAAAVDVEPKAGGADLRKGVDAVGHGLLHLGVGLLLAWGLGPSWRSFGLAVGVASLTEALQALTPLRSVELEDWVVNVVAVAVGVGLLRLRRARAGTIGATGEAE